MSGAEAILVVGLLSSIHTIFEAAYQVYSAAHDAKGLDKAFRLAAEQIPLVLHTLELIENNLSGRNASERIVDGVRPILERCKEKGGFMKDAFDKAVPSKDASRIERYKRAVETRFKSKEIKSSMEAVMRDLALLQQHQTFQDSETMDDIRSAIEELAKPGVDDQLSPRSSHLGSGNIYSHTGSGNQENHTYTNSGAGDFYHSNNMTIHKVQNVSHNYTMNSQRNDIPKPKLFLLPRSINSVFTGREDVLDRLRAILTAGAAERGLQRRVAITGLAGIGKSEVCLKLADQVRESFWSVFWVDVGDHEAAEQAFVSIARRLDLQARNLGEALQGLGGVDHSWLLFLDNADDPLVDYSQYFPPGSRGTVVLTSRNVDCGRAYGRDHCEELTCLDRSDAINLLLRTANLADPSIHRPSAVTVVEALGYHTLAIMLAGSYIAKGHCGLKEYPRVYDTHWKRTTSYTTLQDRSRYGSVLATFEASMSMLERENTETNTDALVILQLLGSLARSPVPMALFKSACEEMTCVRRLDQPGDVDSLSSWHVSMMPGFLKTSGEDCDLYRIVEACGLLQSLSLLDVSGDRGERMLSVHPLVHDWIWRRQQLYEMEANWTIAGSVVALSLYHSGTLRAHEQALRVHVQHLVKVRWEYNLLPRPSIAHLQILYRCADALDDVRADDLALRCLNEIVHELRADREGVALEYINLHKLWARSSLRNGDVWAGVTIWEHVVANEVNLDNGHPDRLSSEHALAGAYESDGQIVKALQLLEHVAEVRNATLSEDDPSRLATGHELARLYEANRRDEKAVALLEHVVRIRNSKLEEDHPDRLSSQHALAGVYEATHQTEKAVGLLEHVVHVRETNLTEDHPDLLASQHELARAYGSNGQGEKAINLLEHVVEMESSLGEEHPDRLASQHVLAKLYRDSGAVDKAVELLEHVVRIRQRTVSEEHPDRLASEYELARSHEAKLEKEQT